MANEDTNVRLEALESEIQAIREQLGAHGTRLDDGAFVSANLVRLSADLVTMIQASNRQVDRDRAAAAEDRAIMREMIAEVREVQAEVRGLQTEMGRVIDRLFNQPNNGGNEDG